jgi:3-oxoacyl-(acyl-carrier-protein) synthase/short-subunit dehydrogenase
VTSNNNEQRLYDAIRMLMKENEQLKTSLAAQHEPIAIVGMACRLPGGVNSLTDYWQLLINGVDTAGPIPAARWDHANYYDSQRPKPGKIYTNQAHFIDAYEQFDADFFGITPKEVESMDPQHRLLIELTHTAFENALIPPRSYHGSNTGVFLGHFTHDYANLISKYADDIDISAYTSIGNSASTLTGRISFLFGFQGPSFPVNTACSSSLVAAHLACHSLRRGECNLAVVGGVNLMLSPEIMINISQAQMLSDDGRCHTFDKRANGYGRGEGAGIVLLKRLSDAISHGDNIEAVILASGTNQDGASSALSVPNGQAQRELLSAVLKSSGLQPKDIDYIEAHGTGTALGDPVEINAINEVYKDSHTQHNPLHISSVKANIGHLEAAAGVTGMIKVALLLKHKIIPPHINLHTLNPAIHLDTVPLTIPSNAMPLSQTKESIAAISAFGFSGSNAHMIIKQAPAALPAHQGKTRNRCITKLSAKSADSLQRVLTTTQNWLGQQVEMSWGDLSYSLNVGRDDHDYRCIITASDLKEFQNGLVEHKSLTQTKKYKAIQWVLSDLTLSHPQLIWIDSKPFLKNTFEAVLNTVNSLLNIKLAMTDLDAVNQLDKANQTLLSFCWNYALALYYKYLGLMPAQVIAHNFAIFPALAAANKLDLHAAILLSDAACTNHNDYHVLVNQATFLSGDFPVNFEVNTVAVKQTLLDLPYTMLKPNQFKAAAPSLISIHFNELINPNPEMILQSQISLAYLHGHPIVWKHYEQGFEQQKIALPNFPFNKKSYLTPVLARMKKKDDMVVASAAMYSTHYLTHELSGDKSDLPDCCLLITDNLEHTQVIAAQLNNNTQLITLVYTKDSYQDVEAAFQKIVPLIHGKLVTIYLLPLFTRSSEAIKEDVLFLQHYQTMIAATGIAHTFYYLTRYASETNSIIIQKDSAAIKGLLKALNFEHAVTHYRALDFDDQHMLQTIAQTVIQEMSFNNNETDIIFRGELRLVPRFTPLVVAAEPRKFKANRSYVITGGLGGLGLALCEHLLALGAGHIHLLSRKIPKPAIQERISLWNKPLVRVQTHSLDICNQEQLTNCLDALQTSGYPIAGYFHLAGTDDRAPFTEYDWPRFNNVLAAKLRGAQLLHQYTQHANLDYFVLFSSIASSVGSARQAPYVVANAYLDALAYERRASGLVGQSIQWGPWAEEGMVNQSSLKLATREHLLSTSEALHGLDKILYHNLSHVTVVQPVFLQFLLGFFVGKLPDFLATSLPTNKNLQESAIALQLRQAQADQYQMLIENFVLTGFKQVTHWDETIDIDVDKSFFDMGIDSLMAIELADYCRIGLATIISVAPTLLFESVSITALITHLSDRIQQALNPAQVNATQEIHQTYSELALKQMSLSDIDAILENHYD